MQSVFLSNNMLYPKEDKDNRILLYAVSSMEPMQCQITDPLHIVCL